MIQTVRAAGFAAAALLIAATAAWSGTSQATQTAQAPASAHFLDHASAVNDPSAFAVNDVEPSPSDERSQPVDQPNRQIASSPEIVSHPMSGLAEHLVAMADAAIPRPRTLDELVFAYAGEATANNEQDCLANAVYFEARGEPIEGQLAVAEVVLNRARSGRYPSTICQVVTQPWQFSFVRRGIIPAADRNSHSWRRAVAVARIAEAGASRLLPADVLWYHAEYVSPSWGRRLARNTKIGLHIFYS